MKLSQLIKEIRAKSTSDDPEIRFILPINSKDFVKTPPEILHRDEYYDESAVSSSPVEKGDFVVLDFINWDAGQ